MSEQGVGNTSQLTTPKRTFWQGFCARGIWWTWVSVLVILLDQLVKHWVVGQLYLGEVRPFTPFFNLTLVYNPGAAWSFLADAGGGQRWFLAGFSTLASVVLLVWLCRLQRCERWLSIALALVLGGALGNLYDRVMWGQVVDFLDFYWSSYHFPAFNLADSAITVGAGMLIFESFFTKKADKKAE